MSCCPSTLPCYFSGVFPGATNLVRYFCNSILLVAVNIVPFDCTVNW